MGKKTNKPFMTNKGDKLLGLNLRKFRESKKYPLSIFAAGLAITEMELRHMEEGRTMPDHATLVMLHDVFDANLKNISAQ